MNILLAVVLLTGLYMVHHEYDPLADRPATIGNVEANSPAGKAGLQAGDLITLIDGKKDPTWEDVFNKVLLNSQANINLSVLRNNHSVDVSLRPEARGQDDLPYTGFLPEVPATVTSVDPGLPADKAGIVNGDVIVALDGNQVHSINAIQSYVRGHGANPLKVSFTRNGALHEVTVTPVLASVEGKSTYRIGFGTSHPLKLDRLPFAQALQLSLDTNRKTSFLILEMLQKLLETKVSLRQMDGPIGMARATGEAVQYRGFPTLVFMMALISVNLGIMNLLPIPILDGGLILLTLIESLIRRDIDQRVKERIYQTAFVFIVIFAVAVVYNDVSKIFLRS